jgi:hypothetical protein
MELMWLAGRLAPDFNTTAYFRKDKGKAIHHVRSPFSVLSRQLNLFSEAVAPIDGRRFTAVNNHEHSHPLTPEDGYLPPLR